MSSHEPRTTDSQARPTCVSTGAPGDGCRLCLLRCPACQRSSAHGLAAEHADLSVPAVPRPVPARADGSRASLNSAQRLDALLLDHSCGGRSGAHRNRGGGGRPPAPGEVSALQSSQQLSDRRWSRFPAAVLPALPSRVVNAAAATIVNLCDMSRTAAVAIGRPLTIDQVAEQREVPSRFVRTWIANLEEI
jgi:hypothetical protein